MPPLYQATFQLLADGRDYLERITAVQYQQPITILSNSSIGQHSRHWIEFFQCLLNQVIDQRPQVCYDIRVRDLQLESDPKQALVAIDQIETDLRQLDLQQPLILQAQVSEEKLALSTSLAREVWYAIEHAIHHLAIIKIGWNTLSHLPDLPADFGIAYSTRLHRQTLANN